MLAFPCLSVIETHLYSDVFAFLWVVRIGKKQDILTQDIVLSTHTDEASHADWLLQSLDVRRVFLPCLTPITCGIHRPSTATLVPHVEHKFTIRQFYHLRFSGVVACRLRNSPCFSMVFAIHDTCMRHSVLINKLHGKY